MTNHFRYSRWDGSQEIDPLQPDELLDLLSDDLPAPPTSTPTPPPAGPGPAGEA